MEKHADKYFKVPRNIFDDRRLKSEDIALLVFFFFRTNGKKDILDLKIEKILNHLQVSRNEFDLTIERLVRFNWIKHMELDQSRDMITIEVIVPEDISDINKDPYTQPGSMIAKAWGKYFGTRMIKHDDIQQLKDYVINGMEEELVLEVMKYSSEKAEGSPFHYTRAVLLDLFKRGVLTVEEFELDRKGESKDGRVSKTNREKEKRNEDEVAREYYRKGYR
ncbi:MAG: DnaD domain protein [Halanaerobiales bacterium]